MMSSNNFLGGFWAFVISNSLGLGKVGPSTFK